MHTYIANNTCNTCDECNVILELEHDTTNSVTFIAVFTR